MRQLCVTFTDRALADAEIARQVAIALERSHAKQFREAGSREHLRHRLATEIRNDSRAAGGIDASARGHREQVKGFFVEGLDQVTYAAAWQRTRRIVLNDDPLQPGFDGHYARGLGARPGGRIQQKSSHYHVRKAINKVADMNGGHVESFTLRLPADHAATARRKAAASPKVSVHAMEFTSAQAELELDRGLSRLRVRGADSSVVAYAAGGLFGALVNAGYGAATDRVTAPPGQFTRRDLAERRFLDAAHGATASVVGMLTMRTAANFTVVFMPRVATAIGVWMPDRHTARAAQVAGHTASLASGKAIDHAFETARRNLEARQQQRRLNPVGAASQLPAARELLTWEQLADHLRPELVDVDALRTDAEQDLLNWVTEMRAQISEDHWSMDVILACASQAAHACGYGPGADPARRDPASFKAWLSAD